MQIIGTKLNKMQKQNWTKTNKGMKNGSQNQSKISKGTELYCWLAGERETRKMCILIQIRKKYS